MFNCANLQIGKRYFFRGTYLTYKGRFESKYLFQSPSGASKKLSEKIVKEAVWEEIDLSKLEAFNE